MKIKTMQLGPIATNCYILMDEQTKLAAVIDPGDEAQKVLEVLADEGATAKYILLTHGHYDHTTAVPDLKAALPQVEVYIHQGDANGAGSTLFPLAGKVDDLLLYDEGDTLALGELQILVMHTPGHSLGGVVLRVGDVLFTGDTLFAGSCGRTDLRGGDYMTLQASLRRLGELEGDYHVCPGHDVTSTLSAERKYNPFLREAMG